MELIYITYQAIPSNTAHGVHTFSLIKNFARNHINVSLVYPLREKNKIKSIDKLREKYGFIDNFEIKPTRHFLPFGKVKIFPRITYIFSNAVWSYFVSKTYSKSQYKYIFTLSDWVFYFLSKKGKNIIFECHNLTKLRIRILKKALSSNINSKVVFINDLIRQDAGFEKDSQVYVLESGYDHDLFTNDDKPDNEKKKIIFSGNLLRFEEDRGIKEILNYFIELKLKQNYQLHIVGGPEEYVNELKESISNLENSEIFFYGHKDRVDLAKILNSADIGLMVNKFSKHSERHTSPLKYFEYLGSGLTVVATEVDSHKILPYSEKINFFNLNDKDSFHKAIIESSNIVGNDYEIELSKLTNDYRTKKLIEIFTARPEGLEPSTP